MKEQLTMLEDNPEYDAFVEKFKPKKTTDDCYTPPEVYEAVKDWVCREYGVAPSRIVRPFWPGGDYESYPYPDGCVVVDNPPFSILANIKRFYKERGIPFFLFAPGLALFSSNDEGLTYIVIENSITYENGAKVNTGFVTNMGGDVLAKTAPELDAAITEAQRKKREESATRPPVYKYPDHVLTAAMLKYLCGHGIPFEVRRKDCAFTRALDNQRAQGKAIFGSGFLLAEKAAAEKAAAEKAAAEKAAAEKAAAIVWQLSDREKAIIRGLSE